jgi:hypothetical protein
MLAPLAVFVSVMLIACTLTLLCCWAYDATRAETEAEVTRSRTAVFTFPVHRSWLDQGMGSPFAVLASGANFQISRRHKPPKGVVRWFD